MGGQGRKATDDGRRTRPKRPVSLGPCLFALTFVLGPWSWIVPPGQAQTAGGDGIYYSQKPAFHIPFQTDPGERRIQQVQLYVSQDKGQTWRQTHTAQPNERHFRFQAQQDGWYFFGVRTIDFQGQAHPPAPEQLQPGLRVCVDTLKPVVVLRPASLPEGGASVEWQITDDNLDPDSLRLEQRPAGAGGDWAPLSADRAATGRHTWNPGTNAPLEVRLQARDRAGNSAEAVVNVTPGGGSGPPGGGAQRTPQETTPTPGGVRRINTKRISLNYEIRDVGKSGVAVVELWYTRDPQARNWAKHDERPNAQPPFVIDVSEEGLYGFTLVARSGVGLGEQPPRLGDQPQLWVEVDLTRPKVQLLNLDVGKGPETGNLTITWSAADKNLGPRPITLSYAEKPDGPWTPIAASEENTGRFVWRMPAEVPYQFHVRVEAADLAGNVGSAETSKPISVDLSVPKVSGITVEPGK